jgi:hypothetical protein
MPADSLLHISIIGFVFELAWTGIKRFKTGSSYSFSLRYALRLRPGLLNQEV